MSVILGFLFFFFKQKTAYEMRISDWSSDVCSSDLVKPHKGPIACQLFPSVLEDLYAAHQGQENQDDVIHRSRQAEDAAGFIGQGAEQVAEQLHGQAH